MDQREISLNARELNRIVSNDQLFSKVTKSAMYARQTPGNGSRRPSTAGGRAPAPTSFSPISGSYNPFKKPVIGGRPSSAASQRGGQGPVIARHGSSRGSRKSGSRTGSWRPSESTPRMMQQINTARSYSDTQKA